jgi:hypothetical protein
MPRRACRALSSAPSFRAAQTNTAPTIASGTRTTTSATIPATLVIRDSVAPMFPSLGRAARTGARPSTHTVTLCSPGIMFELGRSLHEARVRRGLELAQVAAETRIRTRYLRALEEERFERIPGSVYAKGFLRAYADHLGLDSQLFLDEYNARFSVEETLPMPSQLQLRPRPLRPYLAAAAILLVAVAGALLAWQLSGSSARNAHSLVTSTAAVRASVRATPLPAASVGRRDKPASAALVLRATRGPAGCRFTDKAVPAGTSSREHSSRATRGALAKGLSGYASAPPGTWSQVVEDAGFRSHRRSQPCS